jgi:hypothetical protein
MTVGLRHTQVDWQVPAAGKANLVVKGNMAAKAIFR